MSSSLALRRQYRLRRRGAPRGAVRRSSTAAKIPEVIQAFSCADLWKSFSNISRKDRSEISECGNLLFLVRAPSRRFLKLGVFKLKLFRHV